jgi:UDP-N-acetylmuramoyl-L-alanyl-D-glutamate--2,6-diaminopimelate ligase
MKKLSEYLNEINFLIREQHIFSDPAVKGVSNNSRQIEPGWIFVAIKGANADGHDYISQALANGAVAILYSEETALKGKGNFIRVSDSYYAYAILVEAYFNFPADKLKITGITGTNGKTTTAFMLHKLFTDNGIKTGLISTVKYSSGGDKSEDASRTTPEAVTLQKLFAEMVDSKCVKAVIEVSSHGLDQHRIGRAKLAVGIFTNLSGDHLDYHQNTDNYLEAKSRMFSDYLAKDGTGIINTDDPAGEKIFRKFKDKNLISYGRSASCFCRIKEISSSSRGSIVKLDINGKDFEFSSNLSGEYNAYNWAGAICAANAQGIELDQIADSINRSELSVPGRLERFETANGAVVFVDYAHTDDALKNVLLNLRKISEKKIITLFGCGGNRDKTKRPRMGKIAEEYSDKVIITSDNPRNEEPEAIIKDILTGINEMSKITVITDRRQAIFEAVNLASEGDIVLIAGKGHETYQEINGENTFFDDRKVVVEACLN